MANPIEGEYNFAAITPLNHVKVMGALLERIPSSRRGILEDFAVYIRRVNEMSIGARKAFSGVGIEEDYRVATLVRLFGSKYRVRIWEGLTEQELDLINYFNFVPFCVVSDPVNRFLKPRTEQPVYAHYDASHFGAIPPQIGKIIPRGISVPIMGLNRLVKAARDTREEFFVQQS